MYFSVYTLGCKLNQLESESIIDSFLKAGFSFIPPELISKGNKKLSLIIINTCTVTSMADQKARRIIRKYLRELPGAPIIITGCYAQMEKDILEALDDSPLRAGQAACLKGSSIPNSKKRLFVIPGEKKGELLFLPFFLLENKIDPDYPPIIIDLINSWYSGLNNLKPEEKSLSSSSSFSFLPEKFSSHSRAFLKIQDGCNNSCAYCRVSLARGKSRSFPAGEALATLKKLEDQGYGEAVLTGVNISQYMDSGINLGKLIKYLLKNTGKIRLRLSSIEPDFLTPDFLEVFENPRLRPHLHISLQSGSEEITGKMGRSYKIKDIEKAVELFRTIRKDPFLACDIITGFPGETEEEFKKTREFCEKLEFAWI
ncbi:MAG: radical SAM protein, partial [Treponema sp.]|nr:radical SAM protein [Treponema sp.]